MPYRLLKAFYKVQQRLVRKLEKKVKQLLGLIHCVLQGESDKLDTARAGVLLAAQGLPQGLAAARAQAGEEIQRLLRLMHCVLRGESDKLVTARAGVLLAAQGLPQGLTAARAQAGEEIQQLLGLIHCVL